MSLDVLIAAAQVSAQEPVSGLPPDTLRITLEYPEAPSIDAERDRIADLLQGGNFDLTGFDELLPEFLVLQFNGVERRMAPSTLFAAADALVEPLGLVSAVPDIAATYVIAPDDPSQVEGVGDLFLNITCWARENTGLDKDWSVKSINAPAAWAKATGAGVLIAQPDTGVADHGELSGALDVAKGFNTLTGTPDPFDPLSDRMGNPGHGTATASVVASRQAGEVFGAAPAAKVAPVRCLNRVILGLDPTPVAKAILHAVKVEADVISMSLGGGLHSPVMARALAIAAQSGIISVAAAGNCVQPIVVYPARDPNCVAMGGINHQDRPWKGTSRGRRVDVCAPAENVFVARRKPDDGGEHKVQPSQGTSYATALTAGVAALWVEHFDRAAIRDEAANRGITVNELFRTALRATARPPRSGTWNARKFGAGIVDADRLLDLPLAAIPAPTPLEGVEGEAEGEIALAMEEAFEGIRMAEGPWPRVGAEAVFLLNDAWMRENRGPGIPMESPYRPEPSPGMKTLMPDAVERGLVAARPAADLITPASSRSERDNIVRMLSATMPSGPESSTALNLEAARARLQNGGRDRLVAQAGSVLDMLEGASSEGSNERREVAQRAARVIERVADDDMSALDLSDRITLEALVRINDRPAYRIVNGTIDPNDPLFGEWGGFLSLLVGLEPWTAAVGRINVDGTHVGTGFLVDGKRVVTNRHVLEACADEIFGPGGSSWRFSHGDASVDFSDDADGSKSFGLSRVHQTGRDPIRGIEILSNLDMAVLDIEDGAMGLPDPVPLARSFDPTADQVVIGFPARPGTSALVDPQTGTVSHEIADRLKAIFGTDYGRKYASPGRIMGGPGTLRGDTKDWISTHDGTTLGGSSGSMVVQITPDPAVAGLHFSGAPLTANKAHVLTAVDKSGQGPIDGVRWI